MNEHIELIYIRLMNQYLALDDVADNDLKFAILLDLINFCEDCPHATVDEYREFKDLILTDGPLPRLDARSLN